MTTLFSKFLEKHLYIVAQPIVDSITKKVYFYEILSRVEIDGEIHLPSDFIPDMNIQMKYRLAKFLFKNISKLQQLLPDKSFSLNISSLEIDMGIEEYLKKLLEAEGSFLDASRCIIEITEHSSLDDEKTYESIKNIKHNFGFRFALDDFGSKYSTLDKIYSTENVFDYIKVDGALVKNIETDLMKQVNLQFMVNFIQTNNKKVIVEYVSSEEVYKTIMHVSKPEYLQGFYFGEPKSIKCFFKEETAS
ncbi:MAG: EAL domain-containing protein [Sulfurospirillum sp.]